MQGNVAWNYNHPTTNGWRLLNPPALAGNKLVVSDMEGKVVVLNADTGAVLNTYVTNFHFTQQPAVMNGGIYLGTSNGHLIMIPTGDLSMTGWSQWGGNSRHNK